MEVKGVVGFNGVWTFGGLGWALLGLLARVSG